MLLASMVGAVFTSTEGLEVKRLALLLGGFHIGSPCFLALVGSLDILLPFR
jgi:hypothetical protein